MLVSHFLLATVKETPADAELISHRLMLRAGMIRKLASGLYSWLPLGLRVLRKVESIVREEMNNSGALEVLMPAVQPAELWKESDRWSLYGPELLRIFDRHERAFCFGPTHEEVITDLARRELKSYKQLPSVFYQIQTKFRDEIRPRFGVMRAREFLMKDAYSFSVDKAGMLAIYQRMLAAYENIFNRLCLNYRAVLADTGSIGGSFSHEFQVLANSGEDCVVYSDSSDYAANIEKATALAPSQARQQPSQPLTQTATPGVKTIAELVDCLKVDVRKTVKTLIVRGQPEAPYVALVLRGDHELNETKAAHLAEVAEPLAFVTEEQVLREFNCGFGSLGPVNLKIPCVVDREAAVLADFVCGANQSDRHLLGVNWERDAKFDKVADIRNVIEGDASPDGQGKLLFARGIEVGHVFQLGTKYSKSMGCTVLNEQGVPVPLMMGCYGLGVSRVVAAAIEQNHDEQGIVWPEAMAPFQVVITPIKMKKSVRVREAAEKLYQQLVALGIDVLLDDRNERPGVMFADMDLIGIPHRVVIAERCLDEGLFEYKFRAEAQSQKLPIDAIIELLQKQNSK